MGLCRVVKGYIGVYRFPKIRGTLVGGPYNKDHSIWGAILGFPYVGKLPSSTAEAVSAPLVQDALVLLRASGPGLPAVLNT